LLLQNNLQKGKSNNFQSISNLRIRLTHGKRITLTWIIYYYQAKNQFFENSYLNPVIVSAGLMAS